MGEGVGNAEEIIECETEMLTVPEGITLLINATDIVGGIGGRGDEGGALIKDGGEDGKAEESFARVTVKLLVFNGMTMG